MVTWSIPQACNNAPKQQWLIDWLQAWVGGEPLTEPTILTLNGCDSSLPDLNLSKLNKVEIHSVITHGREGAIRAQGWTDEGEGSRKIELMLFAAFTLSKAPVMKELHVLYTIN